MPKGVPVPTLWTPPRRRAWLLFVVSATALSVVLTRAQEPKPASAGDEAKAQEEIERVAAETRVSPPSINILPFTQLAEEGRMLAEAGRLGQDTTLDMSATAELNEDGSLKPESVNVDWQATANEEVTLFAQHLLTAISQSRILAVLRGNAKTVRLTTRLDRQNVTVGLETELASERDATQLATGYGALLALARRNKAGTNEGSLYEGLKITSDGKLFRLSFEMPKEAVAKLVAEMLDRRAARGAAPPNRR